MAGSTALKKLMFRCSLPLEPGHAIEVNTDWSKFDQNIPEWLINVAFDMMKSWFSPRGWVNNSMKKMTEAGIEYRCE